MNEALSQRERELLDSEMSLFAAQIVTQKISETVEERKARGAQYSEDISFSGQIDGTPNHVFIGKEEEE